MESPVGARAALVIACFLPPAALASGDAVTEADAIRLFLEDSPQARAVPVTIRAVDAESRLDTRVANPNVSYAIEDAAEVRDEFLLFEQELPLTGRRGLLRERAEAASAAAGLTAERDLQAEAYSLKLAFYEVLHGEAALESLRGGVGSLERVVEILRERERHGESSGYDVLRAEQELVEIQIATAAAEGALSAARSRFGAFFDAALRMDTAPLSGDLAPSAVAPSDEEAVDLALSRRSDVRALSAEAQRRELEYRAARRLRFPEPTLIAGWKRVEALGMSDTGFVASLTVPLPIFDRGQPAAARATADLERVELENEILQRQIRAEVLAAAARERTAREAARRYGPEVERRAGELQRIAQTAYDEGESGILELLDAHRTSLALALRALETRYEAKRAQIELDRAIGTEVTP